MTVSDLTSTMRTEQDSIESLEVNVKGPSKVASNANNGPRLSTDCITIHVITETLSCLPFFNVLTPAVRRFLAENIIVESYLPMEKVHVEDPLN